MMDEIPWYRRTDNTGDAIMNYVAALMRYADDVKAEQMRNRETEKARKIYALEKENKKLKKKLKKRKKK